MLLGDKLGDRLLVVTGADELARYTAEGARQLTEVD
jgi:hypothetical protein